MSGQLSAGGGYVQRRIDVEFNLGAAPDVITGLPNTFSGGANTVLATGLRIHASISVTPENAMPHAHVRIYGLTLDVMNQLSTTGKTLPEANGNSITVKAGDQTGTSVVFTGTIKRAEIDANGLPEVALVVTAFTGADAAMRPVAPTTYSGTVDAATVLAGIATKAGYKFENNGVSAMLAYPYYPGTARDQALACARHADCCILFDKGIMAIWPRNGSRGGAVPLISADTGLVGFPSSCEQGGISLTTLYNPSIVANGRVQVQSALTRANGTWQVISTEHELQSETPNGAWFTHLTTWAQGHTT